MGVMNVEPLRRFSGGVEYRVEKDRERRRLEGGGGSWAVGEAAGDWVVSVVESKRAVASGQSVVETLPC